MAVVISGLDYEWSLFRLVLRALRESKPRGKQNGRLKSPRDISSRGHFLSRVTQDGQSERRTSIRRLWRLQVGFKIT